jgi:hypothetical protein
MQAQHAAAPEQRGQVAAVGPSSCALAHKDSQHCSQLQQCTQRRYSGRHPHNSTLQREQMQRFSSTQQAVLGELDVDAAATAAAAGTHILQPFTSERLCQQSLLLLQKLGHARTACRTAACNGQM